MIVIIIIITTTITLFNDNFIQDRPFRGMIAVCGGTMMKLRQLYHT